MSKPRVLLFASLLVLAASAAHADRSVSKSVAAEADGHVSVEVISGKVELIGWDRDEVEVTGSVGDDVEELRVRSVAGHVSIDLEIDDEDGRHGSRDIDARLTVNVPRNSSVEIESVSADVSVEETDGAVSIESVSGRVTVRAAVREAEIESVSGRIEVTSASALEEGEFETVSGDIALDAALQAGGSYSFESVSGNIELRLPRDVSASFEVETFSGRIVNALGPEARRESEHGPGMTLSFSTGDGAARVEIESFSGRVELRER